MQTLSRRFERSSYYEENRLNPLKYTFSVKGWLYDSDYFLEKTPPEIKYGGKEVHRWSLQLCDGADANEIDQKLQQALRELESVYSFDLKPRSLVFGKHGEILFNHQSDQIFVQTEPGLSKDDLAGRVIEVKLCLESDQGGTIRAYPRLVQVLPKDYIYTPVSMIPDPNEKVCFEDW